MLHLKEKQCQTELKKKKNQNSTKNIDNFIDKSEDFCEKSS